MKILTGSGVKKIILLGLSLLLSSQVFSKDKYEPQCKVSGFDNQTICNTKEYGVYVYDRPTVLSSVSISGIWTSADPSNIGLTISLGDISSIIESVSFNIDGDIDTFEIPVRTTKSTHIGGTLWRSTGMVVLPKEYVEKMLKAKEVKYRVVTVSSGYREGSFHSKEGQETEPVKTLKALISKTKE